VSAAYGCFNRINFLTDGSIEVKRVLIAQEQLKATSQRQKELDAMLQLVDEAEAIVADTSRSLDEFGRLARELENKESADKEDNQRQYQ
jgi:hypothetical protein